ncbi:hypothetical protein GDO81_006312 [Engystomops pustulosus]|uniref:Vomeronasal type-1 receptor n=1 Tax=Engystomops pustulosus TaxID=76066 RepID=A0AAV7CWW8_ENGPU|nr:hypothetical protein GDO81_006312 [Engystomops pustulosus]
MLKSEVFKMILFSFQTIFGSIWNLLIWLVNIYSMVKDLSFNPLVLIVSHLAFANILSLLSRGLPRLMRIFVVSDFVNETTCAVIIYIYRITRAHSITTTCTLTVYQMVTISPSTSLWIHLKAAITLHIKHIIAILCLIEMAIYFPVILPSKYENTTASFVALNTGFCQTPPTSLHHTAVYLVISSVCEFLIVILMMFSSGYILLILRKHSKQMKYFRFPSRISADAKAAKSVIQLLALYIIFFLLDIACMIYGAVSQELSVDLTDIRIILSSCYASFSPFIIMRYRIKVTKPG